MRPPFIVRDEVSAEELWTLKTHLGAKAVRPDGTMQCPACGAWDFGPTDTIETAVRVWLRGGVLPAGGVLGGVCMTCELITNPDRVTAPEADLGSGRDFEWSTVYPPPD